MWKSRGHLSSTRAGALRDRSNPPCRGESRTRPAGMRPRRYTRRARCMTSRAFGRVGTTSGRSSTTRSVPSKAAIVASAVSPGHRHTLLGAPRRSRARPRLLAERDRRLHATLASECGIAVESGARTCTTRSMPSVTRFDIVYTGIGRRWVAPRLIAGRRSSPTYSDPAACLPGRDTSSRRGDGPRRPNPEQDIFEADFARWDEKGGTYAAPDAVLDHTTTYERVHALSEVITAVLDAG